MSEEDQPRSPQQKFDPPSSSENPKTLISAEEDQLNPSPKSSHDRNSDDGKVEDDCFQTPTSSEHRIPAVQGCPAPPRKSRPKRKLDDADDRMPPFVEEARREEVESFFRVNNDGVVSERESRARSRSAKRRCRSI